MNIRDLGHNEFPFDQVTGNPTDDAAAAVITGLILDAIIAADTHPAVNQRKPVSIRNYLLSPIPSRRPKKVIYDHRLNITNFTGPPMTVQ